MVSILTLLKICLRVLNVTWEGRIQPSFYGDAGRRQVFQIPCVLSTFLTWKYFQDVAALSLIMCLTPQMPGCQNYSSVRLNKGICLPLHTHMLAYLYAEYLDFNCVDEYCVSSSRLRCVNLCVNLDNFDRCQSVV